MSIEASLTIKWNFHRNVQVEQHMTVTQLAFIYALNTNLKL